MNCQKYTRNSASNILVHCNRSDPNRTYGNQEIDHSKSHLNYNLAPQREITDFEFMKNRCEELNILKRNNVNWMSSWITTLPKDFTGDKKDFFRESYSFFENRYGKGNVISAYVHYDETSPHLHFTFVPAVYDSKKEKIVVNAKKCISKFELQKIHSEMQNYLEEKLQTKVNILNGATKDGNKSIRQLKSEQKVIDLAVKELVANPTTEVLSKIIDKQLKDIHVPLAPREPIEIKRISADETQKLGKREAREELKTKIDEVSMLSMENQNLFNQNKKMREILHASQNSKQYADVTREEIKELKRENKLTKSELDNLQEKYGRLESTFHYFIQKVQNLFFTFYNAFTPKQKEQHYYEMVEIKENFSKEPGEIILDTEVEKDNAIIEEYQRQQELEEQEKEDSWDLEMG